MKIVYLGEYDPSEITLAPIKVGKELFKSFENLGHNIYYLPYFQDGKIFSRIQKLFGFEKITDRVFRTGIFPLLSFVIKFKPQLLHIITPGLYYVPLFLLRFFFRFKIVSTLHSINRYVIPQYSSIKGYQKFRFLLIDYLLVKFSDYVFVYSEREKRYISLIYKIKREKIKVVNNGFNKINLTKEKFSVSSPLKVAFVGQISRKEKAFDLLIKALWQLDINVQVSVFNYYKQKTAIYSSLKNVDVHFFDPLNNSDFRKQLVVNDLLIVPSLYEPFSITLLEAMSAGIIFIASSRVGLVERYSSNLKRLVFKNGSAEDLVDRINLYLEMDSDQKLLLSSEINNFTKNYSWENISKEYFKTYNDILKN